MKSIVQGLKLKKLLRRRGKVLAVLGAPNAFHAKIMEASGVEACFVGRAAITPDSPISVFSR